MHTLCILLSFISMITGGILALRWERRRYTAVSVQVREEDGVWYVWCESLGLTVSGATKEEALQKAADAYVHASIKRLEGV